MLNLSVVRLFFNECTLEKGDYFVQQNQPCQQIAYIGSGMLRIFYATEQGDDVTVCFCTPNSLTTSFRSVTQQEPSPLSIQALEQTQLLIIDYSDLQHLYRTSPVWQTIGRLLVEKQYLVVEQYASVLNRETAQEKYSRLLREQPQVIQKAMIKHIASYLGVSRETLSRIRQLASPDSVIFVTYSPRIRRYVCRVIEPNILQRCILTHKSDQPLKRATQPLSKAPPKAGFFLNSPVAMPPRWPLTSAKKIGYFEQQLQAVPDGANLGIGCGNPTALASIQSGETILDLGSGAGFDCFLAAQQTGPTGTVIGVDITPAMVDKARQNANQNVEFRVGEIENLPVSPNSIDLILSNCVINLSSQKEQVFLEAYRVLKPGGRMLISDIILLRPLPDFIQNSLAGYVACLSGAITKDDYVAAIAKAGFVAIQIDKQTHFPIELMLSDPMAQQIINQHRLTPQAIEAIANSIASISVSGRKAAYWLGSSTSRPYTLLPLLHTP